MKKKVLIIVLFLIFLVPLFFIILQSVAFSWRWPELLPSEFSFRGWRALINEPRLGEALQSTILIGVAVVLLNFLIGIPAAKALAYYSFPGKNTIDVLLLSPILIPNLAIAMGLHFTFIRLGIANHMLGVIFVHLIPTVPYTIRIFRGGFERIGDKWGEVGATLGASSWQIFWTVQLPMMVPTIRSAAVLIFVISLSQYALTALIGGGNIMTLAMLYFPYFQSNDPAVLASFSAVFILFPIIFLIVLELILRLFLFRRRKVLSM